MPTGGLKDPLFGFHIHTLCFASLAFNVVSLQPYIWGVPCKEITKAMKGQSRPPLLHCHTIARTKIHQQLYNDHDFTWEPHFSGSCLQACSSSAHAHLSTGLVATQNYCPLAFIPCSHLATRNVTSQSVACYHSAHGTAYG
eukprot:1155848-Pelagomonas_calceolata.AAC.4